MAITNIESTGFDSLFSVSLKLTKQTVEANVPTQKEKNLKADNRSLTRENISLEAQNKLLTEKNEELKKDNKILSQKVNQYQSEKSQDLYDNSSQYAIQSEQKTDSYEENIPASNSIGKSNLVNPATQQTDIASYTGYSTTSELSTAAELGNSFNSFA